MHSSVVSLFQITVPSHEAPEEAGISTGPDSHVAKPNWQLSL